MMRAEEHRKALQDKLTTFFERKPHFVIAEIDEETPEYLDFTLRTRVKEETDPYWSVILGDFLHGLRSTLDHLVYALAALNRKRPRGTQFPIFLDYCEFQVKGLPYLGGVHEAARTIIEELQPYQVPEPKDHPLALLAALSNADKHRLLQSTAFKPTRIEERVRNALGAGHIEVHEITKPGPVKDNAPIFRGRFVPDTPGPISVKVNFALATEIFVDERWPIGDVFWIETFIRNSVVPRFEGFFPPPVGPASTEKG
jgi:hypothetical protein